MKVGDLVKVKRYRFEDEPYYAIIVAFDKDNDPIISYVGGDSTPHYVFRSNIEVLSSADQRSSK